MSFAGDCVREEKVFEINLYHLFDELLVNHIASCQKIDWFIAIYKEFWFPIKLINNSTFTRISEFVCWTRLSVFWWNTISSETSVKLLPLNLIRYLSNSWLLECMHVLRRSATNPYNCHMKGIPTMWITIFGPRIYFSTNANII